MTLSVETIRHNLALVHERIDKAAASVRRPSSEVKLVVVSKRQPVELIVAAARAGANIFGENYAEEIPPKQALLGDIPGLQWHMIGHIQSRKTKIVAECVDFVHSVDSLALAERLDRDALVRERGMPVLLEMNVSSEETKGGWPAWNEAHWSELIPVIESVLTRENLEIRGLMVMPPLFENPEQVRPYFSRLARLRDFLATRFPTVNWTELSMGTSADYEIGIQEGATFVRIGQAILGPRPARIFN